MAFRTIYMATISPVAIIVYLDAHHVGLTAGGGSKGRQFGAVSWALGVLTFPILFLPGYALRRYRLFRQARRGERA